MTDKGIIIVSFILAIIVYALSTLEKKRVPIGEYWFIWGVKVVDIINPLKWISYIKGSFISLFVSRAYMEQLMYRAYVCKPCVDRGHCINCNCNTWGKMLDPKARCSAGKFGEMQTSKKWYQTVTEYNISYNFTAGKK